MKRRTDRVYNLRTVPPDTYSANVHVIQGQHHDLATLGNIRKYKAYHFIKDSFKIFPECNFSKDEKVGKLIVLENKSPQEGLIFFVIAPSYKTKW